MGSSSRKKKEKKKDFQKPKLRVGKTKARPDNFTDTSFKSKSIVVNQQSLSTSAPSSTSQFTHYLSLASSSKSDTQRRDALSYLTTHLSSQPVSDPLPLPCSVLLPKLLPLILDGASSVRKRLFKLLRCLPASEVTPHIESALLYIRAGMTHLAAEIRLDTLDILEWLLQIAPEETVTSPGGWVKTLKAFGTMMGWVGAKGDGKWTSASKASFGKGGKARPRMMLVLAQFLRAGLQEDEMEATPGLRGSAFPLWDAGRNMLPTRANAYAHLNLFGSNRDEEGEMYIDREDRQRVYQKRFRVDVEEGVGNARKEGGEAGRAAAVLAKVLKDGMADYAGDDAL